MDAGLAGGRGRRGVGREVVGVRVPIATSHQVVAPTRVGGWGRDSSGCPRARDMRGRPRARLHRGAHRPGASQLGALEGVLGERL